MRWTAIFLVIVYLASSAVAAAAETSHPQGPRLGETEPVDWHDFLPNASADGDHVVGEELCANVCDNVYMTQR